MSPRILRTSILAISLTASLLASAHCDTLSGPVLSAARNALDSGNVNLVLVWVQPKDEAKVRDAFELARQNRQAEGIDGKSTHAFFETLVRVHREGEGATFEGIKAADTDVGPAVPAAERTLELNDIEGLDAMLHERMKQEILAQHRSVVEKKKYDPNDLVKGRAYVGAYVNYMHYVEGLYQAATNTSPHGHEPATGAATMGHDDHGKGPSISGQDDHGKGASIPGHDDPAKGASAAAHRHANDGHAGHAYGSEGHTGHVPWLLAGLFGVVMVGQTSWIVSRRKRQQS